MVRLFVVSIAVLAMTAPALTTPAMAREAAPSVIVVMGRGQVETRPDHFELSSELQGRGASQVDALRALAEVQARVTQVGDMDGLTSARLTTGAPSVAPTFDPSCGQDDYDREEAGCAVVGYVASMTLKLAASPVERAGDAVSLASERGARSAAIESFGLSDIDAQRVQAQRQAFDDARQQAEALAAASGRRIVRLIRLEDPNTRASDVGAFPDRSVDDIVLNRLRARPTVSLNVAPPPVRTEARVLATFEIE